MPPHRCRRNSHLGTSATSARVAASNSGQTKTSLKRFPSPSPSPSPSTSTLAAHLATAQPLPRLFVPLLGPPHDLVRNCPPPTPLQAPLEPLLEPTRRQPVPQVLLVETRLRLSALVLFLGPEPRRVRREHLVDEDHLGRCAIFERESRCCRVRAGQGRDWD